MSPNSRPRRSRPAPCQPHARRYAIPATAPDLRVPVREIMLDKSSGEPPLPVYDTTGPYTDNDVAINVEKAKLRPWLDLVSHDVTLIERRDGAGGFGAVATDHG